MKRIIITGLGLCLLVALAVIMFTCNKAKFNATTMEVQAAYKEATQWYDGNFSSVHDTIYFHASTENTNSRTSIAEVEYRLHGIRLPWVEAKILSDMKRFLIKHPRTEPAAPSHGAPRAAGER